MFRAVADVIVGITKHDEIMELTLNPPGFPWPRTDVLDNVHYSAPSIQTR